MSRFGLHGKFLAQPGEGDALAGHLLVAAEALEANGDCELYVIGRSPGEPDAVWVTEVWSSEDAHRASLDDDRVRHQIARVRPLIAKMPDHVRTLPVGGKGLAG